MDTFRCSCGAAGWVRLSPSGVVMTGFREESPGGRGSGTGLTDWEEGPSGTCKVKTI